MGKQTWVGTKVTAQSDGPVLTAAARASCLPLAARTTFNPGDLDALGTHLHVKAWGKMSSVITTPGTMRFDLSFSSGPSLVFDGLAVLLDTTAAHSNVGWKLELDLVLRAIGTSANFHGIGLLTCEAIKGTGTMPVTDGVAILPWNTAPLVGANFDSTLANTVDLFFTQTVGTGSLTLNGYSLKVEN